MRLCPACRLFALNPTEMLCTLCEEARVEKEGAADYSAGSQDENVQPTQQLISEDEIWAMENAAKDCDYDMANPDERAYARDVGALLAERAAFIPLIQAMDALCKVRSSFRPFGHDAHFVIEPNGPDGSYSCRIHDCVGYGNSITEAVFDAVEKVKKEKNLNG